MNIRIFYTQRNRDFKTVFGTEEGKRVLGHIYKMCGMNRQPHVPGDPYDSAFHMGKMRVGQGIQGILSQSETDIFELLKVLNPQGQMANTLDDYDPLKPKEG